VSREQEKAQHNQIRQNFVTRERYLAAQLQVQKLLLGTRGDQAPYDELLALLGKASQASRVYVFENRYDDSRQLLTTQTAEWCAKGFEPRLNHPDVTNRSLERGLSRWVEVLSNGSSISSLTSDLPNAEQRLLKRLGVKAILVLPVTVNGEFFGFVGFDNCVSDEMWDVAAGGVRQSWQPYIKTIEALGPDVLERRHMEIRRLLRENGVTYSVHGDPNGLHRPWELDPVPVIIASDEWDRLETGLAQRAAASKSGCGSDQSSCNDTASEGIPA